MSELQHDETVINSVFRQHKVSARVARTHGATFQSAAWNVFHIEKAPGVKVDTIVKLKPEIDYALTHMQPRAIVCHIDPLSLRIMTPRRTPAKIDMIQRLQRIARDEYGKRTLGALVGEVVTSRGVGSQLIDLSRPETPHMLVAGQSGSGKSYEMINIVVSMAMLNNSRNLEIMVLDPKAVDWHIINGLPGLKYRVIEDLDACVAAFDDAMRELEYRKAQRMKNPQKRYVVVVDEMADLITTGGADVVRGIERIVQIGRGYGVHLIGGTQKPTNSVFGSDTIKANMPLRLVGRFSQKTDANTAAGVTGSGAETLFNKGSFVKVDNGMDMVQAYHLDESRLVDWLRNNMVDVQEYAQKRRATTPATPGEWQDATPVRMDATTYTPHRDDIAMAMPVFAQYYNPATGELERGATAAIIRRLYGKDANTGGANRTAALAIMDKLIHIHTTTTRPQMAEFAQNYGD